MSAPPAFRTVMLALGTPTGQLEAAWEASDQPVVTADELAAAKRLIARMTRVAEGQTVNAASDADAAVLGRFGQPRPVRRGRGKVEISFETATLREIDEARTAIERTRDDLAALEARRLALMVRAVDHEHESVTAVALAAGITRERFYQLRRAATSAD